MITKLAMNTGNFSYLCPDLFGIFRNSHRLQCTHCARCDFQNLLKNIRLYDPKNLRNALLVDAVPASDFFVPIRHLRCGYSALTRG